MTIEVVDPTEIHYKSKSNGTIIRAASMNGKLLLTCGDSLGSINLCLETGGFIEYTCNTLSLVVSCKYVKLEIGNEHQEISNQTTEEKEKENGVRD